MKLSNNLPQFNDTPSLLIVSGFQSGKVFYALNGEIELDKEIDVPDHTYSDDEGFFQRMTSRIKGSMGSGSVKERKKKHIRDEFLNEFIAHIKGRVEALNIKHIYLFSPQESLKGLQDALPHNVEDLVVGSYSGNYTHHDPNDLVEIIQEEKPEPVKMMSEEARKILDKNEES